MRCEHSSAPLTHAHSCSLPILTAMRMLLLPCLALALTLAIASSGCSSLADPVKSAYFDYGQGQDANEVDATPFTHVFYAFAVMDNATFAVVPAADDAGRISTFSASMRRSNPKVKTLLSIGGGGSNASASAFSRMAATSATRAAFIQQSIAAAMLYDFDGLDLDWEIPQSDVDMANLGLLFAEWRAAVRAQKKTKRHSQGCTEELLLTAAVQYNVTVVNGGARTYPVDSIARNLDWITIMAYDLHDGSWEAVPKTGEHTALYDTINLQTLTVNFGVRQWLAAGLPPQRAALGLAAYGRSWYLSDPAQHGVGAPATGAGPILTFTQIQQSVQANRGSSTCAHDSITRCAFCFWRDTSHHNSTLWVGFDDPSTIAIKVRYLKSLRLRGYAFWRISGDRQGLLFKKASNTL